MTFNKGTESRNTIPKFTSDQLLYLDRVFSENTDVLSESQMHHRTGQRSVVKHIEYLIEQARKAQEVK